MTDKEREANRVRARAYYAANRERLLARQRADRAADPDGCRAYSQAKRQKRRARMAAEVPA